MESKSFVFEKPSGRCVETLHRLQQVEGSADTIFVLLVHCLFDDFASRARLQRTPQVPIEAHLEETVRVLDRARLGNHNKNSLLGEKKEIDDIEGDTCSDVEEDDVGIDLANSRKQARLLEVFQIGRGKGGRGRR